MQLHYAPNTISTAVALALFEAGAEFERVPVDFASAEQTGPAYHTINPKGRVPALVTDRGVLTETGALLDFIAATYPDAGLVPSEPFAAARMREVMYYIASTMHVNHAHKRRGARWADRQSSWDDMAAKVAETMTASAAYVDANALAGPFVLGDRFSIADCYLFVVCNWLAADGVDTAPFGKLTAFMAAMEARASVRTARASGML